MIFTKKKWVNVPDPSNLPPAPEGQDALARFDAENMNRIENGIEEALNQSKESVGLGNVPNVTTNDQTPTYEEATTLETLTSGEKISIAFGKIKKAITDLISHLANKSNPHNVTKKQIGLGSITISDEITIGHGTTATNKSVVIGDIAWGTSGSVAVGNSAESYNNAGVAIGSYAKTSDGTGGVAVGYAAESHGGAAVGNDAIAGDGGAAIGFNAIAEAGGAVGSQAKAMHGGAVGNCAIAGHGFSGGAAATVGTDLNDEYIDAIQLGEGTNKNPKTLQIYNHTLMDADGIIPIERLTKAARIATDSYTGTGKYGEEHPNILTFDFEPKFVFVLGLSGSYQQPLVLIRGMSQFASNNKIDDYSGITWGDKSVSWYTNSTIGQHNGSNTTYHYVAIG